MTHADATVALDHVVWAVSDLSEAAAQISARTGLVPCGGGVHPAWGTRNALLAAGTSYLELITVADDAVAQASAFGRCVRRAIHDGGRPVLWALRVADLVSVAARLGLSVQQGERLSADGSVIRWSTAGTEVAAMTGLPFFIEWPGGGQAPHLPSNIRPGTAILAVLTSDEPARLETWAGGRLACLGPAR